MEDLQQISGIGPNIEADLSSIGIKTIDDLKGKNPERLYQNFCDHMGRPVDRCVLYVFRCAVYFAEEKLPKAELLKWWNWTDKKQFAAASNAAGTLKFSIENFLRPAKGEI